MEFSKYNIFGRIKDSDEYYIVNLLSGNADILGQDKAKEILEKRYTGIEEYAAKGYLVDPDEERSVYTRRYREFVAKRSCEEIQLFFVPWYDCNFSCSYCYQGGYGAEDTALAPEAVDSFYGYIESEFHERRKYVTIFGGEPL